MRRRRHQRRETKVWHNPNITAAGRRAESQAAAAKDGPADPARRRDSTRPRRVGARIVAVTTERDPQAVEQERLLQRILTAEGRSSIAQAADSYLGAGFDFPERQDVWLQLLEHQNEAMVARAIERLSDLLIDEAPLREAVLESRLRRIEEYADEPATQNAAAGLRRALTKVVAVPMTRHEPTSTHDG